MADSTLGPLVTGIVWLGGGLVFGLLKTYCGKEKEALAGARKVKNIRELESIAYSFSKKEHDTIVATVGRVNADNPLKCKNSKIQAVVLEETVEQVFLKQANGNNWVKDSTYLQGSKQQVPWFLEDKTGRVHVENAQLASGFRLFLASDVVEEPSTSGTVRTMLDIAQGIRVLCVRRAERALPVGTVVTVVGEVGRHDAGGVVLRKPKNGGPFFVSSDSLEQLVSHYGATTSFLGSLSFGCTAVGVIVLAVRAWELFQGWKVSRRGEAYQRRPRPSGAAASNTDDGISNQCVICLDRDYSVAFFPCGHVCCCKECIEGIHQCPLCRERIQQKSNIYLH